MGRVYARPASPLIGLILWTFAGVSSQAQNIESKGPQLRELNNALLRIHGNMQQTRADQWEGLRAEAGPVLEQRFAALSDLIQRNPGEALKFAFSPELADELAAKFPQFVSLIERHRSWQGPVERWVMDYADRKSSREVLWLKTGTEALEVHFAGQEPAGLKSGDVVEVTGVQVGRLLAVTNDANAAAESGERLDIRDDNTRRRHSPVGTTPTSTTTTAGAACTTTGVQNTAVLLVTWPGVTLPSNITSQSVYDMFFSPAGPSLDSYWREASYGQTSATGNVFGPFPLDSSYANCGRLDVLRDAAITAAANAGVAIQNYSRIFLVTPEFGCGWTGMAINGCTSLNSPAGSFTASASILDASWQGSQTQGAENAAHEGGHNMGLAHAQSRTFGIEPLGDLGAAGTITEYGDPFSDMSTSNIGHYAAPHKAEILNWISSTNYQVVQSSGTWTLQPLEINPAGLVALKVQRGTGNNAWLWIEYRQAIGYDSNVWPPAGALIHYEDSTTGAHTQLLDFTPATTGMYDSAVMPGTTWVDPYTNVSITVQSATANGLTVSVNYGAALCTPANPTVTASPLDPSIYPGNSTGYNVSITNNDSAACTASTFNLGSSQPSGWPSSFSANAISLSPGQSGSVTMTKTGPSGTPPGTYAVNTYAANASNSVYTGSGTANVTVMSAPSMTATLSVPSSSYTRKGLVTLTAAVLNAGTPVGGASVTFTMTTANGSTVTQSATTGRKGTATWSYKLSSNSPTGTYSATSRATLNSMSATSNRVSFSVQ